MKAVSISSTHELKQLQTRLTKLELDQKAKAEEIKMLQRIYSDISSQINTIKQKIESIKGREPIVTEHAMLRYIERVLGINLEEVKMQILNEKTLAMINSLGSGKFPGDGYKVVVKNRSVITIEA